MLQFHALFGGHYGIGSMIVDAVIRSVVYNMVGNAMRGHALSGLALIGIVLAVVCVCSADPLLWGHGQRCWPKPSRWQTPVLTRSTLLCVICSVTALLPMAIGCWRWAIFSEKE